MVRCGYERGDNMIDVMVTKLVMRWIHRRYLKYGETIFYIRGTGRDYPRYLLYTEEPRVYEKFDRIGEVEGQNND